MTKSIYGYYQVGDRLHTRDGDSRALRAMACSRLAANRQRSSADKESGHGLKIHQEHKTKNGFAAFAPLPHCGKRASGCQEQDAGDAVGAGPKLRLKFHRISRQVGKLEKPFTWTVVRVAQGLAKLFIFLVCCISCDPKQARPQAVDVSAKSDSIQNHKFHAKIVDVEVIGNNTLAARRWEIRFQIVKKLEGGKNLHENDIFGIQVSSPVRFTNYPEGNRPRNWIIELDPKTNFNTSIDERHVLLLKSLTEEKSRIH